VIEPNGAESRPVPEDNIQITPPRPTEPQRDLEGRFVPGSSGNPNGRPLGTRSTVREAARRVQCMSEAAVKRIFQSIFDPSRSERDRDYLALKVVEMSGVPNLIAALQQQQPADLDTFRFLQAATDEELAEVEAVLDRIRARLSRLPDAGRYGLTPTPVNQRDAFSVRALPSAPEPQVDAPQPVPVDVAEVIPPPQDEEYFG
jgi:hypothetical protein